MDRSNARLSRRLEPKGIHWGFDALVNNNDASEIGDSPTKFIADIRITQ